MSLFLSKKQKQAMKERRKKKFLAENGLLPLLDSKEKSNKSTKRPRSDSDVHQNGNGEISNSSDARITTTQQVQNRPKSKSVTVTIPSNLSTKDTKKFRKDARRKLRLDNEEIQDRSIQFVREGDELPSSSSSATPPPSKKAKQWQYPCINDLVRQQQEQKMQSQQQQIEEELDETYKSRYVALDCEMVGIGSNGRQSALARVSLVDWDGRTLLDTYVQVPIKVTDYRTAVSGVKPKHIKNTTAMDVATCRTTVSNIIKDKIVVGHALHNDFDALMLQHPKTHVRDTAKYRPFQRLSGSGGGGKGGGGGQKWRPRKLRDLVLEHCNIVIQQTGQSHDSVDDAKATMSLFRTVHEAWEKEIQVQSTIKNKSK
jgi:RNA exonuclease 4